MKIEHILRNNYRIMNTAKAHEFRIKCPSCNNVKQKCYVNCIKNVYRCWHCGESGSLYKFIRRFHSEIDLKSLELEKTSMSIKSQFKTPMALPEGFAPFFSTERESPMLDACVEYLYERGLNYDMIKDYGMGYSRRFAHQVVVPIRNTMGKQVYFSTLTIDKKLAFPHNPSISDNYFSKGDILFNINRISPSTVVYLTEGIFDCISCVKSGKQAVALLGKEITDNQIELLLSLGMTEIAICLDGGEVTSTYKMAKKLKRYFDYVYICLLPEGKDPNDLDLTDYLLPYIEDLKLYLPKDKNKDLLNKFKSIFKKPLT